MSESSNPIIGPITDNIINSFVNEVKKSKNRDKIMKNIIDPILSDINHKYFPYVVMLVLLLLIIIILQITLVVINVKSNKS
jgi:hypothetical protein